MGYFIDGNTRVISLTPGTVLLSVKDLWSRWYEWYLTGDNPKFPLAFAQVGGNDIDASEGTSIPIYIFLQNGWRVRPQEANHTLKVTEGILLVDGGGEPFLSTLGSFNVRVNYSQPVQAITINTGGGGGGLTVEQATKLEELWKLQGLKVGASMVVNEATGTRTVEDIILDITDTPTTVTVSRRP